MNTQEKRPAEPRFTLMLPGVGELRDLFRFQEARFGIAAQKLVQRLKTELDWPAQGEVDLDDELEHVRLGTERAPAEEANG